jgi:hypothetical protein
VGVRSGGNHLCSGPFVRNDDRMLDLTGYELVWPPELFAAEATRILGRPMLGQQAIDLLLREAFRDDNAAEDVASLGGGFREGDPDEVRYLRAEHLRGAARRSGQATREVCGLVRCLGSGAGSYCSVSTRPARAPAR